VSSARKQEKNRNLKGNGKEVLFPGKGALENTAILGRSRRRREKGIVDRFVPERRSSSKKSPPPGPFVGALRVQREELAGEAR